MSRTLIVSMSDEDFERYQDWQECVAFRIEDLGDGTGKLIVTDDLERITRPEPPPSVPCPSALIVRVSPVNPVQSGAPIKCPRAVGAAGGVAPNAGGSMQREHIPYGYCQCGCGRQTARHRANDIKRGHVKGEPLRFIQGHNALRKGPLYRVDPGSGCWIWLRSTNGVGYGKLRRDGREHYAHRWFYEQHVRPIPAGLDLDHLCRNRLCCNPEHLEPVTRTENLRRGFGPAAVNARKTHCINGHPLSGPNLYVEPKGRRQCRTCREDAERSRERAA